jgi:transglutaminase-like putative cysteine protease
MMLYRVRHVTTYAYAQLVAQSQHVLRLRPRLTDNQVCASSEVTLTPSPLRRYARDDYFGNRLETVTLDEPHDRFVVSAESLVRVTKRRPRDLENTLSVEKTAIALTEARAEPFLEASQFIFDTALTRPETARLDQWAAADFAPTRPTALAARALMARIKRDFAYKPGVTDVATPVDRVFELKAGVCQDLAHVMIAALRQRGLAARYVSGYLLTRPPPGRPRLQGADQSHAWVQVFCPPLGWVDFDPTNNLMPDDEHITLAAGRDYADVAPIAGIVVGGGEHSVTVNVDVAPVEAPMPAAAARP